MIYSLVLLLSLVLSGPVEALTAADIDSYFQQQWDQAGLEPSREVSDGLFARRAWLDIAGVIPPPEAVLDHEASASSRKRQELVDSLLAREEFPRAWASRLKNLYLVSSDLARDKARTSHFEGWLEKSLASGTPYDQLVRKLIAGRGPIHTNPEVAFVGQFRDNTEALTGTVAKVFLGVQIQCAQCHDHPFEKWKRTDFYGMQAFFARSKAAQFPMAGLEALQRGDMDSMVKATEQAGKDPRKMRRRAKVFKRIVDNLPPPSMEPPKRMKERTERLASNGKMMNTFVIFDRPAGEAIMPDLDAPPPERKARPKGQRIKPRFLDGKAAPWPDRGVNRREELAAWMTDAANPYLARALVNRVWAMLLGRGLVEPTDNIADPSDDTHAEFLSRLARHFVDTGFDIKALIRLITSSRVYALSIAPSGSNGKDQSLFSRGRTRALEPEQLFASYLQATGLAGALRRRDAERFERVLDSLRVRFARIFENDGDSDQEFHGTLTQSLFLLNGEAVNQAARVRKHSMAWEAMDAGDSTGIDILYLAALARQPTRGEIRTAMAHLDAARADSEDDDGPRLARERAWSDLYWALLTSSEFLLNH